MARNPNEIIAEIGPQKSKERYDKSWSDFLAFCNTPTPGESEYLQYFDYLKNAKGYKASSIWAEYSKLNSSHFIKFGSRLQQWPRISALLKNYMSGYERKKARAFNHEELISFFSSTSTQSSRWKLRKCAAALSYCGGLRCCELRSLKCEDLTKSDDGWWVSFYPGKARGEISRSKFLVPFDGKDNIGSHVSAYMDILERQKICSDYLFKTVILKTDSLIPRPMGKNALAKVGSEIAEFLHLDHPEEYTGHCFRRTAAKRAADQGANLVQLKRHFHWSGQNVAMRYIDESTHHSTYMAKLISGDSEQQTSSGGIRTQASQIAATSSTTTSGGFNFHIAPGASVVIHNYAASKEDK